MKFYVEKSAIQVAVSAAGRNVAVKAAIPTLMDLFIRTDDGHVSVTGYNLDAGTTTVIPANIEEPGSFCAPAKLTENILKSMPDGVLTVEFNEATNQCRITCGKAKMHLMCHNSEGYPELPDFNGDGISIAMKPSVLQSLFVVTFAVSADAKRPVHTGVNLECSEDGSDLIAVALDGFKVAVRKEKAENITGEFTSVVIPGGVCEEASRLCGSIKWGKDDTVILHISGRHVQFAIGSTVIFSRRLEGEFLKWKNALPSISGSMPVLVSRADLQLASERAGILASAGTKTPVRFTLNKDICNVQVQSAIGTMEDSVSIVSEIENLEIGFNNRYLQDVLRAADDDQLKLHFGGPNKPVLITSVDDDNDRFVYMLLPIRLKAGL